MQDPIKTIRSVLDALETDKDISMIEMPSERVTLIIIAAQLMLISNQLDELNNTMDTVRNSIV